MTHCQQFSYDTPSGACLDCEPLFPPQTHCCFDVLLVSHVWSFCTHTFCVTAVAMLACTVAQACRALIDNPKLWQYYFGGSINITAHMRKAFLNGYSKLVQIERQRHQSLNDFTMNIGRCQKTQSMSQQKSDFSLFVLTTN